MQDLSQTKINERDEIIRELKDKIIELEIRLDQYLIFQELKKRLYNQKKAQEI